MLREFANRISANVRGIDLACRYGGEEFVVVMPDTDIAFAYTVAERLRQSIEMHADRDQPRSQRAQRSRSASVSPRRTAVTISPDQLLQRADQALYRAKREGRNRVIAEAA